MPDALQFAKKARGPLASVWYCSLCKGRDGFRITIPHTPPGRSGRGRGFGLASASIARAEIVKHVKTAHPEALTVH